jgi:hypothetical protein
VRFKKCCRLLGETLEEVAVSIAVRPGEMRAWVKSGRIPSHVALLLFLREQDFLRAKGLLD